MQTRKMTANFVKLSLSFFLSLPLAIYADNTTIKNQINTQFPNSRVEFVESILVGAIETNQDILEDRQQLQGLEDKYLQGQTLSSENLEWLNNLAVTYKLSTPDFTSKRTWDELNKRVDIIPASLVLAQAIEESGWGESKLAKSANNYFGQRCGSSVCHTKSQKTAFKGYASYADADEAISTYMHNLNSNAAYKKMREIRYNERANNQKINSTELVNGLNAYSTLRERYIWKIKSVVRSFNLQQFDSI